MAFIALDGNRTVYINEAANLSNKDRIYACKNEFCSAKMQIAAIGNEGEKSSKHSPRPYFTTQRTGENHIEGCMYGSSTTGVNTRYDDAGFNLENFAEMLLTNTKRSSTDSNQNGGTLSSGYSPSNTSIKNLTQFYYFAKQHSPIYEISGKNLCTILSDQRERSVLYFSKFNKFYGKVMAEVTFQYYNSKDKIIEINPLFNSKLTFELAFEDEKLFILIKDKIFSDKKKPFVVFADWDKTIFTIYSSKQVSFPTIIK